ELGNVINIDRLGTEDNHITLLGVKIPQIIVPVRPGRNLAIIIEVAAMNYRLKSMGQMGTDKLDQNLLKILQGR
ncbi:MAG: hypothetical protein WCP73_03435, partial [Eubacteriales bacterium]